MGPVIQRRSFLHNSQYRPLIRLRKVHNPFLARLQRLVECLVKISFLVIAFLSHPSKVVIYGSAPLVSCGPSATVNSLLSLPRPRYPVCNHSEKRSSRTFSALKAGLVSVRDREDPRLLDRRVVKQDEALSERLNALTPVAHFGSLVPITLLRAEAASNGQRKRRAWVERDVV